MASSRFFAPCRYTSMLINAPALAIQALSLRSIGLPINQDSAESSRGGTNSRRNADVILELSEAAKKLITRPAV